MLNDLKRKEMRLMQEWKEIEGLFAENKTPEEVCIFRTKYAMRWYMRKANWNKRMYYILSIVGILCPLINAALVVCIDCPVFSVILSSITSFAASILALTNARLKWENYRTAAEFLKREFTLFQAGIGAYAGEKKTSVYLYSIEEFMQKTHTNWQKVFEKEIYKEKKSIDL